jgi:hypothetical protein
MLRKPIVAAREVAAGIRVNSEISSANVKARLWVQAQTHPLKSRDYLERVVH